MTRSIKLKEEIFPNLLHDGVPLKIELIDDKLIFDFGDRLSKTVFDDNGVPYDIYPYSSFRVIYVLNNCYLEDDNLVEFIDYSKILRKNALIYCSISEAIEIINKKEYKIEILHEAFNSKFCWLQCLLNRKRKGWIGSIDWCIPVREVIYEWEDKENVE